MKKIPKLSVMGILLLLLVCVLASCGGHKHTPTEPKIENEVPATCTEEGSYDEVIYCADCGEIIKKERKTAGKTPHQISSPVMENEVAAGCLTDGSYDLVVYCSVCDEEVVRTSYTVERLGHTEVTVPGYAATEAVDGMTDGVACSTCGEDIVPRQVIPAEISGTEIRATELTLTGTRLSLTVPSGTLTYDLTGKILHNSKTSSLLSRTEDGTEAISSLLALREGENVCYLIVTDKDGATLVYEINVYRKHTYTVTFDTDGAEPILPQDVEEGMRATSPETEKTGYTFAGWYCGDTLYDFSSPVTSGITLTARWEKIPYTVTYMDGDARLELAPDSYDVETEILDLPTPARKHYSFAGWYTDPELTKEITGIAKGSVGDLTLYAKFEPVVYKLTYVTGGGTSSNPESFTAGSSFPITLTDAAMDGFTFIGWYTTPTFDPETRIDEISFAALDIGDLTLYARFESVSYKINYFNGETRLELDPSEYRYGTEQELPEIRKDHYTFAGWYTSPTFEDGTRLDKITADSASDLNLYAKLEPIVYTITYYLSGGTNPEGNIVTYTVEDQSFRFLDPSREGYLFHGWYTDPNYKNQIVSLKGRTGNITLYAKWIERDDSGILTPEVPI